MMHVFFDRTVGGRRVSFLIQTRKFTLLNERTMFYFSASILSPQSTYVGKAPVCQSYTRSAASRPALFLSSLHLSLLHFLYPCCMAVYVYLPWQQKDERQSPIFPPPPSAFRSSSTFFVSQTKLLQTERQQRQLNCLSVDVENFLFFPVQDSCSHCMQDVKRISKGSILARRVTVSFSFHLMFLL